MNQPASDKVVDANSSPVAIVVASALGLNNLFNLFIFILAIWLVSGTETASRLRPYSTRRGRLFPLGCSSGAKIKNQFSSGLVVFQAADNRSAIRVATSFPVVFVPHGHRKNLC